MSDNNNIRILEAAVANQGEEKASVAPNTEDLSISGAIAKIAAQALLDNANGTRKLFPNTRKAWGSAVELAADKGRQVKAAQVGFSEQGAVNVLSKLDEDGIVNLVKKASIQARNKA